MYKRRLRETESEEPQWFYTEIKSEIKLKKSMNRKIRNTQDEKEKIRLRDRYEREKKIVVLQNKINGEIYIYRRPPPIAASPIADSRIRG